MASLLVLGAAGIWPQTASASDTPFVMDTCDAPLGHAFVLQNGRLRGDRIHSAFDGGGPIDDVFMSILAKTGCFDFVESGRDPLIRYKIQYAPVLNIYHDDQDVRATQTWEDAAVTFFKAAKKRKDLTKKSPVKVNPNIFGPEDKRMDPKRLSAVVRVVDYHTGELAAFAVATSSSADFSTKGFVVPDGAGLNSRNIGKRPFMPRKRSKRLANAFGGAINAALGQIRSDTGASSDLGVAADARGRRTPRDKGWSRRIAEPSQAADPFTIMAQRQNDNSFKAPVLPDPDANLRMSGKLVETFTFNIKKATQKKVLVTNWWGDSYVRKVGMVSDYDTDVVLKLALPARAGITDPHVMCFLQKDANYSFARVQTNPMGEYGYTDALAESLSTLSPGDTLTVSGKYDGAYSAQNGVALQACLVETG